MLAQNFKAPADLKMTDTEFEALIKVLGMLERGELENHRCVNKTGDGRAAYMPTIPNGFDMQCAGQRTECGTVACIGGWMAVVMGDEDLKYVYSIMPGTPLYALCWQATSDKIRTDQAAIAVRNFLTFGEPRWDEALAE